jgi:flavin-binding protein dodecin
MTQKVIEVVGTSKESFVKAAENAVAEAAKTVRGLRPQKVRSAIHTNESYRA